MKISDEFAVYVTVTGISHYPNAKRLLSGDKVILRREKENEYDSSAVAVISEFGKNGYVANSENTVRNGTMSASRLCELVDDTAEAVVTEGGYYEAICRLVDVYDTDKMILAACSHYGEGCYDKAIDLFLKLCEKYDTFLLMKYTADCLNKLGRYEESLKFALRATELDETSMPCLMMYADALHKTGRYAEAMVNYKRILAISENSIVRARYEECIRLSKNDGK